MKTLKLESGAFNQELLTTIGINKVGWNGEDHDKLVSALFSRLQDEEGNPLGLSDERKHVLSLIFHPTTELQRTVLTETFASAEYELDGGAQAAFALLFNVVQFGEYLQNKENPKTKKPFVAKPPNRVKKKTFDALLAEEPQAEPEPVTDSAELPPVEDEKSAQTAPKESKKAQDRK